MARDWSLLSNHGRALLLLARRPASRLRELGGELGLTPRAVQDTLRDLERGGYLERHREGRRNRYVVRGDRPMHDPVSADSDAADLLHALGAEPRVPPTSGPRRAVVLACSDHRYQEPLRDLVAAEGLIGRSELLLWPGGSSALAGPEGTRILDAVELAAGSAPPRVILVAHQDCRVPGAAVRASTDAFRTRRAVAERRRRAADRVRRRFGVEPELWFLDRRGARRVATPPPRLTPIPAAEAAIT
jgi:DNA-binding transcriptional ArsR family regulator